MYRDTFLHFLQTPMGVLASGSAHARPFTQPLIIMRGNFPPHMSTESSSNNIISLKMEDDLNFLKMEDDINFLKMEDDINFLEMEDTSTF